MMLDAASGERTIVTIAKIACLVLHNRLVRVYREIGGHYRLVFSGNAASETVDARGGGTPAFIRLHRTECNPARGREVDTPVELYRGELETTFGRMHLAVDDEGVLVETWLPGRAKRTESTQNLTPAARSGLELAKKQLDEYFGRKRRTFDLRFQPRGTAFELQIWKRLCDIPYGRTVSYGTIATELGLINGARAVGRANGANPIPIVIPCHRVIGSNGELVGFGGGLPLKRALLELEEAITVQPALF